MSHTHTPQLDNFTGRISLKPKCVEQILPTHEAGPLWWSHAVLLCSLPNRKGKQKLSMKIVPLAWVSHWNHWGEAEKIPLRDSDLIVPRFDVGVWLLGSSAAWVEKHCLKTLWFVKLGASHLRIRLQCGRPGFDPWVEKIPWRRAWQPIPENSHGQRSLTGCSLWGCKDLDTTEWLSTAQQTQLKLI